MKILDCTLRDGGYYTAWDFPKSLVKKYLVAMKAANIDIVELGLRNFPKEQFLGAHAYTTDDFILSLDIPDTLEIAVMIDAKTILNHHKGVVEGINKLFSHKSESPVDIVRVAAHFTEVENCKSITDRLRELGYVVGFNLMQSGGRSAEEIESVAKQINSWESVDVLYFADSLGNMGSKDVKKINDALRVSWDGTMGIHTHNNQGQALSNSLTAIDLGIQWIDSTVLGMGRGAGNSETELLTLELESLKQNYRSMPIWKLVLDEFQPLKSKHGWGASLLYHYAAKHGVHPTYVQNLLTEKRYTSDQIIQALTHLAPLKSSSYNAALLKKGVSGLINEPSKIEGTWNAKNWCKGNEVILIGAGNSVLQYKEAIEAFITSRNPTTISLNIHNEISDDLIDCYVAIDPLRLLLEVGTYEEKGKPLFTSLKNLPQEIQDKMSSLNVRDYGFYLNPNSFSTYEFNCEIPKQLSLAYSLSLAEIGGATKVWLVGFDGYDAGDNRQEEMIELLEKLKDSDISVECVCLTPTTYPLTQGSIYAPY